MIFSVSVVLKFLSIFGDALSFIFWHIFALFRRLDGRTGYDVACVICYRLRNIIAVTCMSIGCVIVV